MIASFESTTGLPQRETPEDPLLMAMIAWRDHGDEAAAREIVQQLAPLVRSIAFQRLPLGWMVDDAVQNTMANLFRSIHSFDPRVPLSAWTVCLAKNVCSNIMRGWRRRTVFSSADLGIDELHQFDSGERSPSLDEAIMAREELRHIARRAAGMEETDRLVINLLLVGGSSGEDVSARTGLSTGAVRVRAFRLRSALRESLDAENTRCPRQPDAPQRRQTSNVVRRPNSVARV